MLKDGKWPFGGNPTVGYRTNGYDELLLDEVCPSVEGFFEIYAKTELTRDVRHRYTTEV